MFSMLTSRSRRASLCLLAAALFSAIVSTAAAQTGTTSEVLDQSNRPASIEHPAGTLTPPAPPAPLSPEAIDRWTSPEGLSSSLQIMLLLTVLSLAPAILLMTTCFLRIVVVLGLLRQALGTQQLPPSQVITSISLFLTILVMTPTWKQVYDGAIAPYTAGEIGLEQAWDRGVEPVRRFMANQIHRTGNDGDVFLFLRYLPETETTRDGEPIDFVYYGASEKRQNVPLRALVPAFMLSELKTAFLIGFQVFLPFVIIDIVVASVTISMGMMMLPPVLISLPFKLLLFVMVDGWHLVVEMLLESFTILT